MRRFWIGCLWFSLVLAATPSSSQLTKIDPPKIEQLKSFLQAHYLTPEDYVISKFKDHDIVFLGEYHRIRHDPELVQALIPLLYKAGVHTLGFEFGVFEDQSEVARFLSASAYEEALPRKFLFHGDPLWGYKEYLDIYRAAWQLNHSLPPGAPRFRVLNLNYPNQRKVDVDKYMAQVVLDEVVAKKEKALIYCGMHHAFTRYHQPVYDFKKGSLIRLNDERLGNLVYKQVGNRAMTISLHLPWVSSKGWDAPEVRPVNGVIDEVMSKFQDTHVGFDVAGSPFERLPAADTYYAFGYPSFTLGEFTDGYIYQGPFRDYQGVTVDPQFITLSNLKEAQEAVAVLAGAEASKQLASPEIFQMAIQEDDNIERRVKHLQ